MSTVAELTRVPGWPGSSDSSCWLLKRGNVEMIKASLTTFTLALVIKVWYSVSSADKVNDYSAFTYL
jgi:hypothetical protein